MPTALTGTNNSPTRADQKPAWVEKGTIVSVDLRNWTVDVLTEYESKFFGSIQLTNPYFHTYRGEGIFAMPEIGSICLLLRMSDEDTPVVLGFIGSFEMEHSKQADLEDKVGEAETETEEISDLNTPSSTTTSGAAGQVVSGASARAGRPFLNPGDIMMQTRDQNFVILRRGGVIQIGATPVCQTIYIPLKNFLRQFCENYELSTPGGELLWDIQRQENDPGGEAPVLYRLALRDKAQNDKADVQLKIGHVSDTIRYELQVAPQGITTADGTVSGSKFKMTVDNSGNQSFVISGSLTHTITGNRSATITGSDSVEITGSRTLRANSELIELVQGHTLKSMSSLEEITQTKTIKASMVKIGKAPTYSVVLGELLVAWLAKHTHPASWTVPDASVAELPNILSNTVKVSK
jgi:hypothetical protein